MKYALISSNELRETGFRVAEVVEVPFEVYHTLFFVECLDDVVADQFWYDPSDKKIKPIESNVFEE